MDIKAEVRRAAVLIGKAENMRVSASKVVCDLRDYCKGDGRAEFVTLYGVKPTVESIYEAVQAEPEYPDAYRSLGSFRTLLAIEGSTEKDVANRQSHKVYDAGRSQSVMENSALVNDENSTNTGLVDDALDAKLRPVPFDPLALGEDDDEYEYEIDDERPVDEFGDRIYDEAELYEDFSGYDWKNIAILYVHSTWELREEKRARSKAEARIAELEAENTELATDRDCLQDELEARGIVKQDRSKPKTHEPPSPRVERAVALFFELPAAKHLWLKQRMTETPIQTFRSNGPHVEWIQTFWQCSKEEQDTIREQIKITEQRNAA